MAAFEKTGTWPDGAQIVKEFSALKVHYGCVRPRPIARGGWEKACSKLDMSAWA